MSNGKEFDPFMMGSGQGVPAGVYLAEYVGHETGENDKGPFFRFTFRVTVGPQAGQTAACMADAGRPPSPRNKLGRTLSGLAMRELAVASGSTPTPARARCTRSS